ncbi:hydrophobic surface binding protein A-domain-containing protein [Immersiella caudata]|uniref:Hydrophobic surface binding protein A-domain-containing protein n=1 Tax=Immersiella caudata TaxID=314043 RepID=A0AA39X5C7_9PEZI|nr:hydrophobic surface binding protein A-domain-containing protein [Immersiella caudata]
MKLTTLLAPLSLVATVFAQGVIEQSLTTVNEQALELQQAVESWKGSFLGTLPIIKESTDILDSIHKGTKAAKGSPPLDVLGAIGVAVATQTLAQSVNTTLTTLIAAKPKFDKLLLSPAILINLSLQKAATTKMSEVIIEKVPVELQPTAQELIKPIDAAFEFAIQRFHF